MRIIPVLDVLGGVVVRAVAGRRSEYRPLVSRLTTSTRPEAVAQALLSATGAKELYVADLDAILGDGTTILDPTVFSAKVLFDVGLRTLDQLESMLTQLNVTPVVGTETWMLAPAEWPKPFPATLSFDYYDGRLQTGWADPSESPILGLVDSIIVLDIARVGTGRGPGTEDTIRAFHRDYPRLEIIAGGGVKTREDLRRLGEAGADAALVASALHDGSLRLY